MAEMSAGEKKDLIEEAREDMKRCAEGSEHNRETGLEDLDFARAGNHWPEDIKKQREDEGRVVLTINILPSYLRQVVNDARINSPTIKVSPVDDAADIETAAILSDLIRNIEYTSDADVAYDTGLDCAASNGFGFWRVTADYATADSFEMDLGIGRIRNPFSVYSDPDSQAADSSDWNVAFITEAQTRKAFERRWKGKETVSFDSVDAWGGTAWLNGDSVITAEWWKRELITKKILLVGPPRIEGQPDSTPFVIDVKTFESEDFQAMLAAGAVEVWREREAESYKVTQRFMSGAEILETRDWPGCYIPIVPVWGDEFDIEGKVYRRSLIHDALDAARRYDYWQTSATELVALAPRVPYIGPKGAFNSDAARWATANTESHAYLEYDVKNVDGATPPQRQMLDSGIAAGSIQQALSASDDVKKIIGLYDASMGARSNEVSGRAIMARQREGDVSTFHFQDNQSRAIRHTGRILVDLIPHFYKGPRIVRVRGEDGSERKVQVNKPFPQIDPKTGRLMTRPVVDENGNPVLDPNQQPLVEPMLALHDLTVGKYDVTVSAGPSFTSRRQEAAEQMMEMIRVYPQVAPLIGDLIAKKLDWPGADEIAERLKRMIPAQALGEDGGLPPQIKEFIAKGQKMIELLQANTQKLEQQIAALKADKSVDMINAQTNRMEAETDRMETIADIEANQPPQILAVIPPA